MASIHISSVTFEHHPTGFGIGHARPRVSWRVATTGDLQNWIQESYDIQIGPRNGLAEKTYHVEGSESILVPWPDDALQSRESVWVKIRAHAKTTDKTGSVSSRSTEWSSPATVEAALLEREDWVAKLTTSTLTSNEKEPIPPVLFRKVLPLPEKSGPISTARLHITAHGVYQAFINGQRVGQDEMAPGWTSYNHRLLYQTFDVTASLTSGKSNVFGIELGEGWFAGRLGWQDQRNLYGNRLAFLAQLEIGFETGETCTLTSDETWKSHKSATSRSEIYNGEDHDTREEQDGWNSDPSFDESSWTSTQELEFPSARLISSDMPPVRVLESISPVKIFKSASGKTLIDFGQNLVGKLRVQLPTSPKNEGHKLTFSHAEVLEHDELGMRPLRTAKPSDQIILSPKQPSVWSPKFTFHGFRYVQIDGWPTPDGMPSHNHITALVMYSAMKQTGWFSCSEPLVNKLHDNVIWSMKGNFLSVPTDCPQRDERLGWTGDIQVFSPSANFLFDTKGFMSSWLEDFAAEQLEPSRNGVPPLVVPDILQKSTIFTEPQAVWHDAAVLTPYDLYTSSGDIAVLHRQYPSMKAWVDHGIQYGANGLWDQNIWQLGDWLDPAAPPDEPGAGRTDSVLVADAYLVHVLSTLTKISTLLSSPSDTKHYHHLSQSARTAFAHTYITPAGLLASDTQTAHSLALTFNLFPTPSQTTTSASRLAHLVHQSSYRISTGFAGTPLVTHALSSSGHTQLAYRMLLEKQCPSWLYPITMGATTIWERWDSMLPDGSINPGSMTSFNHYALGSVANWLHAVVGGISPLTPGWRKFLVRPQPGGTITSADVKYESPYGMIECGWKITGDEEAAAAAATDTDTGAGAKTATFNMTVTVPPNSTAVVVLPSTKIKEMVLGGAEEDQGVSIGSGTHHFTCSYQPPKYPPESELKRSVSKPL